MEKKLNIIPPIGYEIDRQKSTFEKIVFKKVNTLSKLPEDWEEYCEQTKNRTYYTYSPYNESHVNETAAHGFYGEFSTKKRAEQFIALGMLLQLRDYWVKHSEFKNAVGIFTWSDGGIVTHNCDINDCAITFPTQEMADKFITCFSDLIKQASPLV